MFRHLSGNPFSVLIFFLLSNFDAGNADADCTFVDSCTCDMTDGSGRVNLHSLALEGNSLYDSAFTVTDGGWNYKYNPCNGFTISFYTNLAIAQSDQFGFAYDLGVQSSALFNYTEGNGLSIHYKSADTVRSSRVLLVCQSGINSNNFEYAGELVILEYDFVLTSPCACPGGCDDNGPTSPLPTLPPGGTDDKSCDFVDSCTCEMSDGSGQVNLHGPALDGTSLYDSAFTIDGGDWWYYKYNPCNGFAAAGFTNLAILQSADYYGSSGYDLGVQSSTYFNYTESNGLSIHYAAFDTVRNSRVLLTCDPGSNDHTLQFIGELVSTEYDFIFTSPCACPGLCDNDGVIAPVTPPPNAGPQCVFVDSCKCIMSDGSGEVNLHSLALDGNTYDSAFSVPTADGWIYRYNPCNGFSLASYLSLAVGQEHQTDGWAYDLGVQGSAHFALSQTSDLSVHYTAADGVRSSRVLLVCQTGVNSDTFEFVGELVTLEYDFILTSPCACPGGCDDNGLTSPLPTLPPGGTDDKTCNFVDSCTCDMSDGSGRINLHGPALQDSFLASAAFTIEGGGWWFKYNPCNGFALAGFSDLAILQSSDSYGYTGYDLGVQSSAYFNYTKSSGLSIHYTAFDAARTSRVLLICEPGSNEHKLEFIGELIITEYDFIFTSPCACPDLCDDDGVITAPQTPPPSGGGGKCVFKDSCTCDMSDGSGEVNLHSLALEGSSLYDSAFSLEVVQTGGDAWIYKYNPCNGFSLSTYSNLAVSQEHETGSWANDLGVQSSALFNLTDSTGLAIHYKSADGVRSSRVLLICQPEINQNTFQFVGELIILEYEFILTSPCACPGKCNDNGPIVPLPTPSPGGGTGDKTCNFIDTCTCEMTDGTGEVNLHALSLYDSWQLYDSAFTEYGADGWYYKYNPCYGFYFSGYYDVAIAQSSDFYGYGYGYELGSQPTAKFIYAESSGLTIKYTATDQGRSSRVLLICEPGTDQHKFTYIGELTTLEYDFTLTTPCACPGGCDEYGIIEPPPSGTYCEKVDSCTCDMTDGTGRINLRSLALKGDTLTEAAFTTDGLDGWLYKYNPCNEFQIVYYYDLALAQVNAHGTAGHDLGVQSTAKFQYSATNGLSIQYDSTDRVRRSRVLLVCDPYAMEATFEFIGELVTLEYDFILKSACACPNGCSDLGVANPVVTQPPGGNGGNLPDNINVNVNQSATKSSSNVWTYVGGTTIALIFHDLLLILVIAAIVIIVKHTMWCRRRNDGAASPYTNMKSVVTGQNNV